MGDLTQFSFEIEASGDPSQPCTLDLTIGLSAQFSAAQSIQVLFWAVGEKQTWVTLVRDPATGLFSTSLDLSPYARSGTYEVRQIRAFTDSGAEINITDDQVGAEGFANAFTFSNPIGDNDDPVFSTVVVSDPVPQEDGSIVLTATFDLVDAGPAGLDLSDVPVEFVGPGGESYFVRAFVDEEGHATATLILDAFSPSGTYTLNTIRIADLALNLNMSNPNVSVSVVNPNGDETKPVLDGFTAEFRVDDQDRQRIDFSAAWSDQGSGPERFYLRVYTPEGSHYDQWVYLDEAGRASGSIDLGPTVMAGIF